VLILGHVSSRLPQKKQKACAPAPTLVTKGASFSADVWGNAVILVDKPQDWTSFDVCGKLRGALQVKKVRIASSS
jgi:hypothetical protein